MSYLKDYNDGPQCWHDYTFLDCRKFEDIFDVDHFIDYLKYDVRIVRDIPEWFTDKSELFSSIRFDRFPCFWFESVKY